MVMMFILSMASRCLVSKKKEPRRIGPNLPAHTYAKNKSRNGVINQLVRLAGLFQKLIPSPRHRRVRHLEMLPEVIGAVKLLLAAAAAKNMAGPDVVFHLCRHGTGEWWPKVDPFETPATVAADVVCGPIGLGLERVKRFVRAAEPDTGPRVGPTVNGVHVTFGLGGRPKAAAAC